MSLANTFHTIEQVRSVCEHGLTTSLDRVKRPVTTAPTNTTQPKPNPTHSNLKFLFQCNLSRRCLLDYKGISTLYLSGYGVFLLNDVVMYFDRIEIRMYGDEIASLSCKFEYVHDNCMVLSQCAMIGLESNQLLVGTIKLLL